MGGLVDADLITRDALKDFLSIGGWNGGTKMHSKKTMMALIIVAAAVFTASAMIVSAESDYSSADTNVAHSSTTGQDYTTIS